MKSTRRDFLLKAGAISAGLSLFPTIIKASALSREGQMAPSDKISMILIGCGGQGRGVINRFLRMEDVRVIAVCDVDDSQTARVKAMVDEAYGNTDCRVYRDFREILEKEKTDTALLALPDHWHAIISCAVANKKIDIFGEKPLARYLDEGRAIVDAVKRNNIIWQTGSQQRSGANFHHAVQLVRNGRIGKVEQVDVSLPDGGHYVGNPPPVPVPDGVDWDLWLGPAPKVPFRGILHFDWRWVMDYSGGNLTDWAGHHIDIAHWGLGLDDTGPISIEGRGRPNNDGYYNVPAEYDFMCEYEGGLKIRVANESKLPNPNGTLWRGTDGWIYVSRSRLLASNDDILHETIGRNEIQIYRSTDHYRNFIDCVRSRKETICPAGAGHRSLSVALLGEIAMITGQKLHWDPKTERFTDNNVYATRLLRKPYREPWQFPV
jgi:predicted dehydrogenase